MVLQHIRLGFHATFPEKTISGINTKTYPPRLSKLYGWMVNICENHPRTWGLGIVRTYLGCEQPWTSLKWSSRPKISSLPLWCRVAVSWNAFINLLSACSEGSPNPGECTHKSDCFGRGWTFRLEIHQSCLQDPWGILRIEDHEKNTF